MLFCKLMLLVFNNKIIEVFFQYSFKIIKLMNLKKHNQFTLRTTEIFTQLLTNGGLPLLGLSFSPSNPLSVYLLYHLYAHAFDLCSSCATDSGCCCLSASTRLIKRILSFISVLCSSLYALDLLHNYCQTAL